MTLLRCAHSLTLLDSHCGLLLILSGYSSHHSCSRDESGLANGTVSDTAAAVTAATVGVSAVTAVAAEASAALDAVVVVV